MSKSLNDEEEKNSSSEIKKQFDEIDSEQALSSNNSANDFASIELERKEVPNVTDDELEEIAKNSLSDYYSNGVKSLLDSNEKSITSLNSKAEKALTNLEEGKEKLNSQIDNAKQNAENQAIKRGLARSSIIMNQLENYDKMKIEQAAKMEKEVNDQISQINYEIETLSSRLEDSLKSFDLSYAVKLQTKINDLKDEQVKKIEKALEYNNKIALQEAEFNAKQKEKNAKYSSGTSSASTQSLSDTTKAKYEVASKYFAGLSKEDALDELLNIDADYYRKHLGNYYYKLYNEISNR